MSKSFAEVVEDAQFGYISQEFGPQYARSWELGLGSAVRGELVLVTMGSPLYNEPEVLRCMVRRDVRLQLATAYELAVYAASNGWNGRRRVMALGSKMVHGAVPMIQPGQGQKRGPMMTVDAAEHGYWENDRSVLCVRV